MNSSKSSACQRDLDATMQRYVDDYGIGPWETHEFNSSDVDDLREYGESVEHAWRIAVTKVGTAMWELIEPLDDEGMHARFLAKRAKESTTSPSPSGLRRGDRDPGGERHRVGRQRCACRHTCAYLATDKDLGVITEIFTEG
jgi:hypothetical protein